MDRVTLSQLCHLSSAPIWFYQTGCFVCICMRQCEILHVIARCPKHWMQKVIVVCVVIGRPSNTQHQHQHQQQQSHKRWRYSHGQSTNLGLRTTRIMASEPHCQPTLCTDQCSRAYYSLSFRFSWCADKCGSVCACVDVKHQYKHHKRAVSPTAAAAWLIVLFNRHAVFLLHFAKVHSGLLSMRCFDNTSSSSDARPLCLLLTQNDTNLSPLIIYL